MEYLLNAFAIPEFGLRRAGNFVVSGLLHLKDHFIPHARNNYHPHLLGDRALGFMSMTLVAVKIFAIVLLSAGPVLPAFSSAITIDNIISLTNQSRADFSLNVLTENQVLNKAAQAKADDMLAKGYFAHVTPDNKTPWDFITAAGYSYLMAGENLAVNFTEAENVEDAWMNSPGHKANILNKSFEQIGIGISQGQYQGHAAIFVVQMFGVPIEQKIALSDKPTIVQTAAVPPPAAPVKQSEPPKQIAINNSKVASAKTSVPEALAISDAQTEVQGEMLAVSANVAGNPVKVLATFGERAVMLSPKGENMWTGSVALSSLSQGNVSVHLKATNIAGVSVDQQLADFSNGTVNNYNVVAPQNSASVKVAWYGHAFDPKTAEGKIYLYFIAGILSCLVLAVGIKRHIQHLNLVANSSFVVILASLLWMVH